jgi:SAM-dependent methyltransferase
MAARDSIQAALVRQFRRPEGVLGRLAGWIMSRRGSNVERNRWTVERLEIEAGHRVLEIGFGPGLAIEWAARRATHGRVVGIDHSRVMWRQARRRNRAAIAAGRVDLRLAAAGDLPQLDLGPPFDRIFTVNCLMFWPDPVATLRALREQLAPGGVLAVTHQPRAPGATAADVLRSAEKIEAQLTAAGFVPFHRDTLRLEPVDALCVLARRSD